MTSLMQFFGKSLNKISKFRLQEKANSTRRRTLALDDEKLTDSPFVDDDDDETEI